ncbi:MAG TPA: hypothetical protein VJS92_00160 [Candidatus Polarisedimenticolaceae bacterium]|nr:hypothetical protein [Candidatus Polarisedimenticolaceae bacterium]
MKRLAAIVLGATALASASGLQAAPVRVRLVEGNVRGMLVVRTLGDKPIAQGEQMQRANGSLVESRFTLHFADGSLWDEKVTFTQRDTFRLESYRHVQRGPSYPTSEIEFDRRSGRFRARTQEAKDKEIKEASGSLEMPADLYNGLATILLKNLGPGAAVTTQIVVFTPKPRLIKMELKYEGNDAAHVGPASKDAWRYLVKLEVGGLAGVFATLLGKDPPDTRYWMIGGEVPAFARFEGAMYLNGPIWRIEMAPVEWTVARR